MGQLMTDKVIDNPILNRPYDEPSRHLAFDDGGITDRIEDYGTRPRAFPPPKSGKIAMPPATTVTPIRVWMVRMRRMTSSFPRAQRVDSARRDAPRGGTALGCRVHSIQFHTYHRGPARKYCKAKWRMQGVFFYVQARPGCSPSAMVATSSWSRQVLAPLCGACGCVLILADPAAAHGGELP
jgi:hypothetical protein